MRRPELLPVILVTLLFGAQTTAAGAARSEPAQSESSREGQGALFWTGVALLAGGAGLAAAGAARWDSSLMMGPYGNWGMMSPASMHGYGRATPFFPSGSQGVSVSRRNTANAMVIGAGAAAATAGLTMVLVSRREKRANRSLRIEAGLGRLDVVYRF